MYMLNILLSLSLGSFLVESSEQKNTNFSSIYIFNYHSTVDNNRTNLMTNDSSENNLKLNIGNLSIQSTEKLIDDNNDNKKEIILQPIHETFNLTPFKSIDKVLERMEQESFKPLLLEEELTITKDKKRDLPTSESATILINSMNNSRMLNSQKITQLNNQTSHQQKNSQNNDQNEQKTNQTNDGDIMKFEDELDIQPHSFNVASRLNVNSTKLASNLENTTIKESTTTTIKPVSKPEEEEESIGKKLKKKHLQMLQLKKKLKNNPDKFKAIKIRAPRLHISNSTSKLFGDKQIRRHKIGYASFVRARNVNLTDYHSDDGVFIKRKRVLHNRELDSSGSENRQIRLIMIHSYKKPAVERFSKRIMINNSANQDNTGGQQLIGVTDQTHHPIFVKLHGNSRLINVGEEKSNTRGLAQLNKGQSNNNPATGPNKIDQKSIQNIFSATYQPSTNRYIPKLLLPRFTRPKMYSLNGFIPKPNVQKFTTTTISSLNVNNAYNSLNQFHRNKSGRKKSDKQFDKISNDETSKRRKFGSKSSTNNIDEDDLNTSSSATRKRQILFMKRKGFGYDEEELNSVKPKSNQPEKKKNTNRRQLKAIDFQFPKANYPKELLESLNIRPQAPKFEYQTFRKDISLNKDNKSGKNYPVYAEIPKTSFQCPEKVSGVFSDIETRCQVWHMCDTQGTKHSFLCANGTVFSEKVGVCDHWYNVDCSPNNVNSVKLTKLY